MSTNRCDFIKTIGVTSVALASSDLVASLVAQSPKGRVLESKFKGLSDIALGEAKRLGATYCDVRFTRNVSDSVTVRDKVVGGGGFGGGGGGGGGFGGGGGRTRVPASGCACCTAASGVLPAVLMSPKNRCERSPAGRRRGEGQRRRQALRRQADAHAGIPDLLGHADQGRPIDGVARRPDHVPAGHQRAVGEDEGHHPDPVVDRPGLRVEVLRVERGFLHRAGVMADGAELHGHRAREREGQDADLHRAGAHRRV